MRLETESSETTFASASLLTEYTKVLDREGPAGLAFLNARVPHRLTTVNRFESGVIRNVYVFDKQGELKPEYVKPVEMHDSFCQFVLRDGFFVSCNTGEDERVAGHRYKGRYNAYVGVPILDNAGALWGTLCHIDLESQEMPEEEFEFFRRASRVLSRYLKFDAA